MQRLTYWVIAAISISAVNLVFLLGVIVQPLSLEWEGFYSKHNTTTLEGGFRLIPVSVNPKNETTDHHRDIYELRREIDKLRRDLDQVRGGLVGHTALHP